MKKYEYKTEKIDALSCFFIKSDSSGFEQKLNEFGQNGWELVNILGGVQIDVLSSTLAFCVFKREVTE